MEKIYCSQVAQNKTRSLKNISKLRDDNDKNNWICKLGKDKLGWVIGDSDIVIISFSYKVKR